MALLVGGRAADAYGDVLAGIGAQKINDMQNLRFHLESLRSRPVLR
ncbi:MAG: hypothetical protein O7E52_25140 [Candidatus Poribacteria bacterium]|nr:hypothetical protein [Candidatus Poribacteria bacterium]